ncbi:MAG: hypothetical protein HY898_30660 [Deltaproteobacteria bacterium]|nr:hypothetical protein [Deltaproteobacteria bacterium]
MRIAWPSLLFLVLCSCSDDAATPWTPSDAGGDAAGSGGGGASGAGGAAGASGTGATAGAAGAGGSTPPTPCDPSCTGTKMCDANAQCVCAPGWEAAGAECVASAISNPATRAKQEVCDRYKAAKAPGYTEWVPGSGGECDPGTVPYDGQVAALRYLDFYRWMLGVGPVQVDPSVASAEQQCAKILNYAFGHSPDPSVKCYTAEGAAACGASLIAGGYGLVGQVDGYAMETDQNLIHRRNVLAVGRAGVWFGASGGSSDMHYGGAYPALATDPAFVAHPGPGINVRSAVPGVWFVQKGTATTPPVAARVFVVSTSEEKPMKVGHHYNDFSSFSPDGWVPEVDVPYRVELWDDASAVFATFETTLVDCS